MVVMRKCLRVKVIYFRAMMCSFLSEVADRMLTKDCNFQVPNTAHHHWGGCDNAKKISAIRNVIFPYILFWNKNTVGVYCVLCTVYCTVGGSPCHHGMARPRVADGRDGLQLEVSCEYIE
jgi:hypothetical protein